MLLADQPMPPLHLRQLGVVRYADGLALQQQLREQRCEDRIPDTLLLLQHHPVLTTTRRWGREHLLASEEMLAARGVEIHETDRGGDITAHAPGQLVAYPILKLEGEERDLPRYVRNLEGAVMDVLQQHGLTGHRIEGEAGVWMEPVHEHGKWEKVCAIGVKGSRFVMSHGLALNVTTDLSIFDLIVPCGLGHRGVTSMQSRLGPRTPTMDVVEKQLAQALARSLRRDLVETPAPS